MKSFTTVLLVSLVGLIGLVRAEDASPFPNYHTTIGIPLAARIKAAEEAMDFDGARIVGGTPSAVGQFPYYAGLLITFVNDRNSICGSTLISSTRAITAAHCWLTLGVGFNGREFTLVLGSNLLYSGGTRITTSDVTLHPEYDRWFLKNDVAIIRFPEITFTENIRSIQLATGSDQYEGAWANIVGFGRTGDGIAIPNDAFLSHATVQVITNALCFETYGELSIYDSTLCASTTNGMSTCGGDSGGPLVANNQLIGVTSFTHLSGCESRLPIGFARITSFVPWIQEHL